MTRQILLVLALTLLSSCTWVKLSEAGMNIQVRDLTATTDCTEVGRVTAVSRAKVAGYNRKAAKLQTELETIARNEAASLNGNTVAAAGPIEGNEQRFAVYQCPEADAG